MSTVDLFSPHFRARFEKRQQGPIDATPTPLRTWNDACRDDGGRVGLARGWFVVIAGNPKFGKSILALNMAAEAMKHGRRVGFISLEMSPEQLAARLYAMCSRTPVHKLEKGGFTKQHFDTVWKAIGPMQNMMEFQTNDVTLWDISQVMNTLHEMREAGVDWFVVDYLQLVGVGDEDSINRQVTEVTSHLARFTKDSDSTTLALSQFNRGTSKDYTQTPRAQGIHGGMIVEATADQVLLLDHSRYDKLDRKAKTWFVLDLNRHGESGPIPIEWDYEHLTLREARPDEEREWPE